MKRFLIDLNFKVLGDKQIAKVKLKSLLDRIEMPEGLMIFDIENPVEENKYVLIKVPARLDTENHEVDISDLLRNIRRKIMHSHVILLDAEILGEVHHE
jgi:hypothetical protein